MGDWEAMEARMEALEERVADLERERSARAEARAKRDLTIRSMMKLHEEEMAEIDEEKARHDAFMAQVRERMGGEDE